MAAVFNTTALVAALFAFVVLADFAVQARHCDPPCDHGFRCVAVNRRERRLRHHTHNVCVPARCFFRARRGRCLNFQRRFHFDPSTMSCKPVRSGACYGRYNRFRSREDCELTCAPRR